MVSATFDTFIALIILVLPIISTIVVIYMLMVPTVKSINAAYVTTYTDNYVFSIQNTPPYPNVFSIAGRLDYEVKDIFNNDNPKLQIMGRVYEMGGLSYVEYYKFGKYISEPNMFYMVDTTSIYTLVLLSYYFGDDYLKSRLGLSGSTYTAFFEYKGAILSPIDVDMNTIDDNEKYFLGQPLPETIVSMITGVENPIGQMGDNDGNSKTYNHIGVDTYNFVKNVFSDQLIDYVPIRTKVYIFENFHNSSNDRLENTRFFVDYAIGTPSETDMGRTITLSYVGEPDSYRYNMYFLGGADTFVMDYGRTIMTTYTNRIIMFNRKDFIYLKGLPVISKMRISLSTLDSINTIDTLSNPVVQMRVYLSQIPTNNSSEILLPALQYLNLPGKKVNVTINGEQKEVCVPISSELRVSTNNNCTDSSTYLVYGMPFLGVIVKLDTYLPDPSKYSPIEMSIMVTLFDSYTKTYIIKTDKLNKENRIVKVVVPMDKILLKDKNMLPSDFYAMISEYDYKIPIRVTVLFKYSYMGKIRYVTASRSMIVMPTPVMKETPMDNPAISELLLKLKGFIS